MKYTIEAFREPYGTCAGHWYVLGGERTDLVAQERMADYRRTFPTLPLRVVENPTRKLIVLNDPSRLDA